MKKLIILICITLNSYAQTYPIIEEFNPGTTWLFTSGAGIQNYGGTENYATTNIGSNPYFNNATITITSPIYSFTNCTTNLTVSFPISGKIENGFDFLSFQYFNGTWITQSTFTGPQTLTPSYLIPNTTTRFRFMLITDCSVNGYKTTNPSCSIIGYTTSCLPSPGNCSGLVSVYYYDITRFTINCSIPLPIELVDFNGIQEDCINSIYWITAIEVNNNYFELEKSNDAINFKVIYKIQSFNNSLTTNKYIYYDKNNNQGLIYYRLKQTDFDGKFTYGNIISIENKCYDEKYIKIVNVLGQEVTEEYRGVKFYIYNNKIIKRNE